MRVPGALIEPLSEALLDMGACSVDVADANAGTEAEVPRFGEPGAETGEAWNDNSITALFDDTVDARAALTAACAASGVVINDPHFDRLADADWVRLTQNQFDPIRISSRLWVVPTWHDVVDHAAINLRLDPGLAFGTGSHPTTRLCLRWLDTYLQPGQSVIDYGCGSGILAVAAKLLGAGHTVGVDIDPNAVTAARENAKANNAAVTFVEADAVHLDTAEIVVANILTNPLRVLAPLICALAAPHGIVVLSGILDTQCDDIARVYAPWIDFEPPAHEEGWVCLWGYKR